MSLMWLDIFRVLEVVGYFSCLLCGWIFFVSLKWLDIFCVLEVVGYFSCL